MAFDINRLLTVLNNTGLQTKDNSLYQLLKQLIEGVGSLNKEVASINNSITNINEAISNTISQVVQFSLGNDSSGSGGNALDALDSIQGDKGARGIDGLSIPAQDGSDGIDGLSIPGKPGVSGRDGLVIPAMDGNDGMDGLSLPPQIQTVLGNVISQLLSGLSIDDTGSEPNIIPFYLNAADIAMLNRSNIFRLISGLVIFRVQSTGEAQLTIASDSESASADTDAFLRFVIDGNPGTLKGLMGYDQGLDRFILGYNGTSGIRIDTSGNFEIPVNLSRYKGVVTAGWGLPAIYASGRLTAQTAAVATVCTYTVGAADGSFEISTCVTVTISTTHNFKVKLDYTDEGSTVRSVELIFQNPLIFNDVVDTITQTLGAAQYLGVVLRIRAKAATAITISTSGTFTTVEYNVEADIKQVA